MRVLRADNYRRMPWKNGGGETAEIAIFPESSSVEDFGWRVSMASVASDGPFSTFPGVDRTLCVIGGEGIRLDIEGFPPTTLTPASMPLRFPADAPTGARLLSGPITDLNVMTRRDRFDHRVERHEIGGFAELAVVDGLLFSCAQRLRTGEGVEIGRHDAILIESSAQPITLEGHGTIYLVRLERRRRFSVNWTADASSAGSSTSAGSSEIMNLSAPP